MYCDCFAAGRFCDRNCNCKGCMNIQKNIDQIHQVRKSIKNRNPQAFKPKLELLKTEKRKSEIKNNK